MPKRDVDSSYLDTSLPFETRARILVGQMTLREKIAQMLHASPPIPRLNIPEHNWWNECLHGVARAGVATVFPQAIGMAAAFDSRLLEDVASAISDEARAKHHAYATKGDRGMYKGLTYWTPNINIFRDPRWGRGQETYGECPYLTSQLGMAFVRGLQGDNSRYLKLVATPKHYAVHSGPEPARHSFNAEVSPRDLHETYLPAFKACVQKAKAGSIMGAYNRTNGEPCCASHTLLQEILRESWGFDGYVVSDCWAIKDLHEHHKVTAGPRESAALAVQNGCDINCGQLYHHLVDAVQEGLLAEADIDRAVVRLFTARMKLGMFDPPESVPYTAIPYSVVGCEEHRALARRMARESIVLLKNADALLPLDRTLGSIAVIGPHADSDLVLNGNYFGIPGQRVTLLEGIRQAAGPETRVWHARGCKVFDQDAGDFGATIDAGFAEALTVAEQADVVILCLGLDPRLEGEENNNANSDGKGDKVDVALPPCQQRFLHAIKDCGKPLILVLTGGSPMAITEFTDTVDAILLTWYPGQEGGHALADILFGEHSPAGRLPVTFVKSLEQLPPFEDYAMEGRTYRFMEEAPLFSFGYGLSYTTFTYSEFTIPAEPVREGQAIAVSVAVTNSGQRDSDDVVQLYLQRRESPVRAPRLQLAAFERIHVPAGETRRVNLTMDEATLCLYDDAGTRRWYPGVVTLHVGGGQPGASGSATVSGDLTLA